MSKTVDKKQSVQFAMKPLAYEQMGEKLIRVTCYLLGTGINRNGSNITKEAIEKANAKLAHLPVVGHLMQDESGNYYLGGHDYSVEDRGNDWEYKPLTVPLGCVAGDKPFVFEEITEEATGTTREYLKVDLIIWNHMSEVMQAAYSRDVYFNHSIEIDNIDGEWDDTNNLRIDGFEYDRACLLGLSDSWLKHVEPCFPESKVYPTYQFSRDEDFNAQFSLLLQEINLFNQSELNSGGDPDLINTGNEPVKQEDKKEGTNVSDFTFTEVTSKIREKVKEMTYKAKTGTEFAKYEIFAFDEANSTVSVVDREGYVAYEIPFLASQHTERGLVVSIEFENKVQKALGLVDKDVDAFDVSKEVDMISKDVSAYDVGIGVGEKVAELNKEYGALKAEYETAKATIANLERHIDVYESDKQAYMRKVHRDKIDAAVNYRREEMGKDADFLEYTLHQDSLYDKTLEQVEKELKEIHYNFLQRTTGGKKGFSAIEAPVIDANREVSELERLYGPDVAKFFV